MGIYYTSSVSSSSFFTTFATFSARYSSKAIATGLGSQTRLNTLRDRDITKLIDLMRGGGKPNYATSPQNISNLRNITSSGLLNNEEDR